VEPQVVGVEVAMPCDILERVADDEDCDNLRVIQVEIPDEEEDFDD
jgi:hypothetical protein